MGIVYYYIAVQLPFVFLHQLSKGKHPWGCPACEVLWAEPRTIRKSKCWVCSEVGQKYTKKGPNGLDKHH
jgi:hypothetical protein